MAAAVGDDDLVGLRQFRHLARPDIGMAEAAMDEQYRIA